MRLIDADALIDTLDRHCDVVCVYSKIQRDVMCGACALGTAFDVIDEQPTIDPAKHGRWMPYEFGDETWHKCSECNTADQYGYRYTAFDGKENVFFSVRHYCPNCGARMDGEEDEADRC